METEYKTGDHYWLILKEWPEDGWVIGKWHGSQFETNEVYANAVNCFVGPRIEPPPLPKKEDPPKGVEAADALMAIFGYERVETKGNEVRYKAK